MGLVVQGGRISWGAFPCHQGMWGVWGGCCTDFSGRLWEHLPGEASRKGLEPEAEEVWAVNSKLFLRHPVPRWAAAKQME